MFVRISLRLSFVSLRFLSFPFSFNFFFSTSFYSFLGPVFRFASRRPQIPLFLRVMSPLFPSLRRVPGKTQRVNAGDKCSLSLPVITLSHSVSGCVNKAAIPLINSRTGSESSHVHLLSFLPPCSAILIAASDDFFPPKRLVSAPRGDCRRRLLLSEI